MRFGRAVRRRFGIAAQRVAVRKHLAWYWRWLFLVLALAVGLALAFWLYDIGSQYAGLDRGETRRELHRLRDEAARLAADNADLRGKAEASQRQLQIEQATQKELAASLQSLQDENARLKDDLAFFRSLMSSGGKAEVVSIYRFQVEHSLLPGEYRYRLLLLQSGPREKEFAGKVELLVNGSQGGKRDVVAVPLQGPGKDPKMPVDFKFYQRLEGTFQVPHGFSASHVQVRVYTAGGGEPKLMKTVDLQ